MVIYSEIESKYRQFLSKISKLENLSFLCKLTLKIQNFEFSTISKSIFSQGQVGNLRTPEEFTTELTHGNHPKNGFYEKSEYEELKYGPKYVYN
jgi:hypothetical protein